MKLLLPWIMAVVHDEFYSDIVCGPTWRILLSHIAPLILIFQAVEKLMIRFHLSHDFGFLLSWSIEPPPPAKHWFCVPYLEERGYSRIDQRYGTKEVRHD